MARTIINMPSNTFFEYISHLFDWLGFKLFREDTFILQISHRSIQAKGICENRFGGDRLDGDCFLGLWRR